MFRKVRRNDKQILSEAESREILRKGSAGVLAVLGDNDYPYAVPLSYALKDNTLYFHGMMAGHKMDSMRKHDKVCFTVIETDQVVPEEYTTYYRSVIAFGRARELKDPDEKRAALMHLVEKYSPNHIEGSHEEIEGKLKAVCIFVIDIEHISGKEAIEFAEARG